MNEWTEDDPDNLNCEGSTIWSTEKEQCIEVYTDEEVPVKSFEEDFVRLPKCPRRWQWNGKVQACQPP
jgi:hypothetical protein